MRSTIVVRIFTAIALAAFASCAQAADWSVQKAFGQVWLQSSGVQKIALRRGGSLKGKTTVITGANGTVVLARNTESMIIGPNASVTVPGPNILGLTTIRQRAGTVVYEVEKRNVRHFAVKTPTLIAVVKGTKFQVSEDDQVSSISVLQGSVRVSNNSTGQSADLSPGQKATVTRGSGRGFVVSGAAPSGLSTGIKVNVSGAGVGSDDGSSGSDGGSGRGGSSGGGSSGGGSGNEGQNQ